MATILSRLSRRKFLASLVTLPAAALLAKLPNTGSDDIVVVRGWILKRSDLA